MRRSEYEHVPLPIDELRAHNPLWLEFTPDSWPGARLDARFLWSSTTERYQFTVAVANYGTIIDWSPVQLNYPYGFANYLRVIFHDPTGRTDHVTASTLGDPVDMTIWPGPDNPAYIPYDVQPGDEYDADNPPEPWMPPLGIEQSAGAF